MKLMKTVEEIKRKKAAKVMGVSSPADEIRKFKGLFDDGIITEEEFLRKKEQLLDEGSPSQLQGDDVVLTVNPADYRPAECKVVNENVTEVNTGAVQKEAGKNASGIYLPGCIFGGILMFIALIGFLVLVIN